MMQIYQVVHPLVYQWDSRFGQEKIHPWVLWLSKRGPLNCVLLSAICVWKNNLLEWNINEATFIHCNLYIWWWTVNFDLRYLLSSFLLSFPFLNYFLRQPWRRRMRSQLPSPGRYILIQKFTQCFVIISHAYINIRVIVMGNQWNM